MTMGCDSRRGALLQTPFSNHRTYSSSIMEDPMGMLRFLWRVRRAAWLAKNLWARDQDHIKTGRPFDGPCFSLTGHERS